MIPPYSVARLPRIVFGTGTVTRVPELARSYGTTALVVTGRRSFRESDRWSALTDGLARQGVGWQAVTVEGEPSPGRVDEAVARFRDAGIAAVVAVGGGSALDAGKAIAGLLPHGNPVLDHLEGVGRGIPYAGPALPCIAVPTTAGTGSEATRNAVLGECGAKGYKKSFRHEALVPEWAVVDPELLQSCPPALIAADGMDAVTQLIESYVSARANAFTDALALAGLEAARDHLLPWFERGEPAEAARAGMAHAALASGICLAQTGLGAVHGLASPLGAFFPIPHGVVCGTLLACATETNLRALEERAPGHPALERYARIGALLAGRAPHDPGADRAALQERLDGWTERLRLPRLGSYGMQADDIARTVAGSRGGSMKTNPIVLTVDELSSILRSRL